MIGIISDIHGNHEALLSVLEELNKLQVHEIFCLGDTAGYYCQVNECCETLRAREIKTLLGNHDWYIISGTQCPRSKSANICLEYQKQILTKENFDWLNQLPKSITTNSLSMVHAGWKNVLDEYIKPTEAYFASFKEHFFSSGHSHVPRIDFFPNKIYCNPGSVGQPRDGDPRASFATFDGKMFSLHRVSYNIAKTQNKMRQAGFSEYFYKNLTSGSRIGGKVDSLSPHPVTQIVPL